MGGGPIASLKLINNTSKEAIFLIKWEPEDKKELKEYQVTETMTIHANRGNYFTAKTIKSIAGN